MPVHGHVFSTDRVRWPGHSVNRTTINVVIDKVGLLLPDQWKLFRQRLCNSFNFHTILTRILTIDVQGSSELLKDIHAIIFNILISKVLLLQHDVDFGLIHDFQLVEFIILLHLLLFDIGLLADEKKLSLFSFRSVS